jgi:hypothetical protein
MVPVSVLFSKINSKIKIRPIKTSFFKKVFAKIECPSLVQFFKKLITRYCDFKMWSINMNGDKSFFLHRGNKHLLGSWVEVRCFSWKTNKENFSNQYTIKKLLEKSNLFKFFFAKPEQMFIPNSKLKFWTLLRIGNSKNFQRRW